jgi:hypothetical protein
MIEWLNWDLESDPLPDDGPYDLITCFKFLDRTLLSWAQAHLAPGGWLIAETFTTEQRERYGTPRREQLVLEPEEFRILLPDLEIVDLDEDWRADQHHTSRVVAHKKNGA